jgi:ubiquinone/menaquinone biosynthesis C-methylase UbiE
MKEAIKNYWETRLPQNWYSDKKKYSEEYFEEIEHERYKKRYSYYKRLFEVGKWKGKKILEIGCGIGTDAATHAESGAVVTGIDLTEQAVKDSKELFERKGLKGEFFTMDSEDLEFPDDHFDMVYSFGVLHHTPKTKEAIMEAFRVCKPGGKVIMMLYAKGMHYWSIIIRKYWLGGEYKTMSKVECISKWTEKEMNCPLTKMYGLRELIRLFLPYKISFLGRYYLGRLPFQKLFEGAFGLHWIVKAKK